MKELGEKYKKRTPRKAQELRSGRRQAQGTTQKRRVGLKMKVLRADEPLTPEDLEILAKSDI